MQLVNAEYVESLVNLPIYARSLTAAGRAVFFLAHGPRGKLLGVIAGPGDTRPEHFDGEHVNLTDGRLTLCPLTHANASVLRQEVPGLCPSPIGLRTSAGCGDRLGLATPGHSRAARRFPALAMIFAQQSIREMSRTARTPEEVMDDATWGLFQEGWQAGQSRTKGESGACLGADADHLKTPADIDRSAEAGFTFYTVDPGDYVDAHADSANEAALRDRYATLPWDELQSSPAGLWASYRGKRFEVEERSWELDEPTLVRAAVKYGRAVAHTLRMYRHLIEVTTGRTGAVQPGNARAATVGNSDSPPVDQEASPLGFDFEVSVDETATPTTHTEHLFVAAELRRLGVRWTSLAPRYVGRFEKGVDYIGDLTEFEHDFAAHAAIARALGPYKLSLHSGSDKFSIYAMAAQHTRGLVHLKTAGTSYLEALRALVAFDPALFRDILGAALRQYETDRASYHVSADVRQVPRPESLSDAQLPALLDQSDARQVLHVTFGSILTSRQGHRARLLAALAAHEEEHYTALEKHLARHLRPFSGTA